MFVDCDGAEIVYGDIVELAEENNQQPHSPVKPGDFLVLRRYAQMAGVFAGVFAAYCPAKKYYLITYSWEVKLASLEERMIYLLEN